VLENKKIVVGVTGSIAAYKSLDIVRELKRLEADVVVVMTENAKRFVTPLSFKTISSNEVIDSLWNKKSMPHIDLGEWMDLLAIVPATANIIGKLASGIADDILSTITLATKSPVLIAPAMNVNMWRNPILRKNVSTLKKFNFHFVEPDTGELASGKIGKGRLATKEKIIKSIIDILNPKLDLKGKNFLVTASRTEEPLDPVRIMTNRSSGKFGYAIAEAAKKRGADVTLISGPSTLDPPQGIEFTQVRTSDQMKEEVLKKVKNTDVLIMTAAVTDYKPESFSQQKLKKTKNKINLPLIRTDDILSSVKAEHIKGLKVCGFSLETSKHIENAKKKLKEKGLDFIVLNDDTALGSDTAKVIIIDKTGATEKLPRTTKKELAEQIIDRIKAA